MPDGSVAAIDIVKVCPGETVDGEAVTDVMVGPVDSYLQEVNSDSASSMKQRLLPSPPSIASRSGPPDNTSSPASPKI
jgi:hypothetical protein